MNKQTLLAMFTALLLAFTSAGAVYANDVTIYWVEPNCHAYGLYQYCPTQQPVETPKEGCNYFKGVNYCPDNTLVGYAHKAVVDTSVFKKVETLVTLKPGCHAYGGVEYCSSGTKTVI